MSLLYPSFYLISDLDPKNDTTHGLMDFLSHVHGEVQTAFMRKDIAPPVGYSLWQVYVNDRRITHAGVCTNDLVTLPYYACDKEFYLPGLGDLVCWKEAKVEITPVSTESWCWIVNSDRYPQYKIRVRPYAYTPEGCESTFCTFDDDGLATASIGGELVDGITVRGFPVTYCDVKSTKKGVGMCIVLHAEAEEEYIIEGTYKKLQRSVSVEIPSVFDWDDYIDAGTIDLCMDDASASIIVGGAKVTVRKDTKSTIAGTLYTDIVAALKKREEEEATMDRFFELMEDTSYSLTVSGADALRAHGDTADVLYKVAVQDTDCITTYEVREDLSCEACDEDGEFSCTCDAGQNGAAFKVSVYEEGSNECEPVLFSFKRNS